MAEALYGYNLQQYIAQGAVARNLDPAAVLAVAEVEGGFGPPPGNVGDGGTSFGPFQLHAGGALPSGIPDPATWANTPAGLDYALDAIAGVCAGTDGLGAIQCQVTRFERPAAPVAEIARAWPLYGLFAAEPIVQNAIAGGSPVPSPGGTSSGAEPPAISPPVFQPGTQSGAVTRPGGGASQEVANIFGVGVPGAGVWHGGLHALSGIGDFLKSPLSGLESLGKSVWGLMQSFATLVAFLIDPTNWLRLIEFVFGLALIGFGLYYFSQTFRSVSTQLVVQAVMRSKAGFSRGGGE